jgi:hypothetical protein
METKEEALARVAVAKFMRDEAVGLEVGTIKPDPFAYAQCKDPVISNDGNEYEADTAQDDKDVQAYAEKSSELYEAALPLLNFLNKHYNQYTYAIVKEGEVELVVSEMTAILPVRD